VNPPKVMPTWSDEPGTQEGLGRSMAMPAMDDVVTGAYVLRNARARGLGTTLRLRHEPLWT